MFVPHVSEIWTKSYGPKYINYTNFLLFEKKTGFQKLFTNCLMHNYSFEDYRLSVFQKLR